MKLELSVVYCILQHLDFEIEMCFYVLDSLWVMMNKETRKLSKMPDEVRGEIGSYFVDSPPLVDDDSRKLPKLDEKTAENIHSGLTVSSSLFLLIFFSFVLQ